MAGIAVLAGDGDLPKWAPRLKRFAAAVLANRGLSGRGLSVLLCGDREMAELNRAWRGKDEPTDILSFGGEAEGEFPAGTGKSYLGDIAISLESLAENARRFGVAEDEELRRLIIHGILHLGGMDHESNETDEPMLRLQETILEELSERRILPERGSA